MPLGTSLSIARSERNRLPLLHSLLCFSSSSVVVIIKSQYKVPRVGGFMLFRVPFGPSLEENSAPVPVGHVQVPHQRLECSPVLVDGGFPPVSALGGPCNRAPHPSEDLPFDCRHGGRTAPCSALAQRGEGRGGHIGRLGGTTQKRRPSTNFAQPFILTIQFVLLRVDSFRRLFDLTPIRSPVRRRLNSHPHAHADAHPHAIEFFLLFLGGREAPPTPRGRCSWRSGAWTP
jgi:hypothetical protein